MKLEFCTCVSPNARVVFERAFQLLCQRLGIAAFQKTVMLHIDQHNYREAGSFMSDEKRELGTTDFHLHLTVTQPAEMLRTLCHEMVHCDQHLNGVLRSESGTAYSKPRLYYHGTCVDPERIPYRQQPWEIEAFAKTPGLADWLLPQMRKEFNNG